MKELWILLLRPEAIFKNMKIWPMLIRQAELVVKLATESNLKIAFAESCTGGLLSSLITSISGSSKIFDRAFILYSNQSKIDFGVPSQVIEQYGAVSQESADQLALLIINKSMADISLSITGIAGPKSDNTQKPVGLVYISSFNKITKKLISKKFNFSGNRESIRNSSIAGAINILNSQLS